MNSVTALSDDEDWPAEVAALSDDEPVKAAKPKRKGTRRIAQGGRLKQFGGLQKKLFSTKRLSQLVRSDCRCQCNCYEPFRKDKVYYELITVCKRICELPKMQSDEFVSWLNCFAHHLANVRGPILEVVSSCFVDLGFQSP